MPDSNIDSTTGNPQSVDMKKVNNKKNIIVAAIIVLVIAILVGIVAAVINLSGLPVDQTGRIRDIFIIMMAVEFLIIGAALIVLIVQLASLINLLQNEVRPILISTKETVANLKGTTRFLSENMVEPVIKLNEYLAGLKKLLDTINIFK